MKVFDKTAMATLCMTVALSSTSVFAQQAPAAVPVVDNAIEEIQSPNEYIVNKVTPMFSRQSQSIRYFEAPDDLIALGVVSNRFQKQVYYTNQTGDYVLSGRLFDVKTKSFHQERILSELNIQLPNEFTEALETSPGFSYGKGSHTLYAVVDTNCGYCKRFHQNVIAKIDSGTLPDVQVKFIPVAALGQDSESKAKAILSLPESEQFEAWQSAVHREPINLATTSEGIENFNKAQAFFRAQNIFSGVPFVVSKVNDGWHVSNGNPNPGFFSTLTQSISETATASAGK